MWFKHFCNLFGRSWNATTAGYGTTTLGFVLWTLLLTADWGVGKAIEFATGRAAGVVGWLLGALTPEPNTVALTRETQAAINQRLGQLP
jgi:hypothetical protein